MVSDHMAHLIIPQDLDLSALFIPRKVSASRLPHIGVLT